MSIKRLASLLLALALIFSLAACGKSNNTASEVTSSTASSKTAESDIITLDNLPEFSGEPFVIVNGNKPNFTEKETAGDSYETYGEHDSLKRCTACIAKIGKDLMPTEDRGSIGQVKPTGWETAKYDCVDGKYLYNRCHLIGFQLTGENANVKNLITGTRYLNVDGMLPFENMVADYVKETGNHCMYRVTPIFNGDELVARGVLMEARSVEDNGEGIEFAVYCYNNQPGIVIDYKTGKSRLATEDESTVTPSTDSGAEADTVGKYILNTSSHKFHSTDCPLAKDIKENNRSEFEGSRDELIDCGYSPCKNCKP